MLLLPGLDIAFSFDPSQARFIFCCTDSRWDRHNGGIDATFEAETDRGQAWAEVEYPYRVTDDQVR